jgi:polyether ionophore transport system permease protein
VHLAGERDLGESILSDRSSTKARTRLLGGPLGIALRLGGGTAFAWTFAIAATALLLGFVAKQAGSSFTTTPSIERVLHKLGLHGGGAQSYLGLSFLIVAVLVAFVAIGQITAAWGEESDGHLEHFLVRPVARWRWLCERWSMGVAIVVETGIVAGLFTWIGSASQHAGVGITSLLAAGVNLVPPAMFILGVGVLAFGAYPRSTGVAAYGVLVWSFLVDLIGSLVSSNHWFLDTSVFRQIAPAPAVSVNWTTDAVLVGLGAAAALAGGLFFRRRDLVSA